MAAKNGKKTTGRAAEKKEKNAVRQGDKPRYGCPPKEHQWKPGQSGNPKGPPIRRTNLWVWFCKYMKLTDAELEKLDHSRLTQAQQTALKLVENAKKGKGSGSQKLALSVFDREEGRAVERLIVESENRLSEEECEDIREVLRNRAD